MTDNTNRPRKNPFVSLYFEKYRLHFIFRLNSHSITFTLERKCSFTSRFLVHQQCSNNLMAYWSIDTIQVFCQAVISKGTTEWMLGSTCQINQKIFDVLLMPDVSCYLDFVQSVYLIIRDVITSNGT